MEIDKLLPLLLTSILTVLSWFILHRLNKSKERDAKRKDLIVSYLIEAWKKLEYASHRFEYDRIKYLEEPIAKIQMFGTKEQIELAQKFASDMSAENQASLTELLFSLRQHLRKELNLESVPKTIKHLRFTNDKIFSHNQHCIQCGMNLPKGQNICWYCNPEKMNEIKKGENNAKMH